MDKSLQKQRDKQQMKPRKNRKIKNTNQNNKSRRKKNKVRKKRHCHTTKQLNEKEFEIANSTLKEKCLSV